MKLHLGCGKRNFGTDWVHIDGGDFPHLHSKDITNLPFNDGSVDIIYASHVIEYFDRDEIILLLKEWRRVLKNNGSLRLSVPDFNSMVNLYLNGHSIETFLGPLYGKMVMSESTIYHKTTYDFKSLKSLLETNGFINTKLYDWRLTDHANIDDHSQAYIPHMDKNNGTLISLNVETFRHEF